MPAFLRLVIPIAIALLTACGGGGGDNPVPSEPASAVSPDSATLDEDTRVDVDVLANDFNVDRTTLTIIRAPANGSAGIAGNAIRYIPEADFNGTDSLEYRVAGTAGVLASTLTLNVNAVNDPPVANSDNASLAPGTSITVQVLANDIDPDDALADLGTRIVATTTDGIAVTNNDGSITYTPDAGFEGTDSLTYQLIDAAGASSDLATVTFLVSAGVNSTLEVTSLVLPETGYASETDSDFGAVQVAELPLSISADTVSFILSLVGADVYGSTGVFLLEIVDPDGNTLPRRETIFCEPGECTIQLPKNLQLPFQPSPGNYTVRIATQALDINVIDFGNHTLHLSRRAGPMPLADSRMQINVQPFVTGNVPTSDIQEILATFAAVASANLVDVNIDPLVRITAPNLAEVSSDFNDTDTATLVTQGPADRVNLFFIESFTGIDGSGLLGISGGLPGTLGIATAFNGVLLNANAVSPAAPGYVQQMGEVTFHEMGHLLGLYHTTEKNNSAFDVITDTAECLPGGGDDAEDCPDGLNIMFWYNEPDVAKQPLTNGQLHVIRSAPITNILQVNGP